MSVDRDEVLRLRLSVANVTVVKFTLTVRTETGFIQLVGLVATDDATIFASFKFGKILVKPVCIVAHPSTLTLGCFFTQFLF
ncbi:MAG TPA: hypothetical protein PL001_00115 [Candidatus Kryptobacter bacterium]|nr:hypothetical protein [Candidatus Kryptobacter bacterium]